MRVLSLIVLVACGMNQPQSQSTEAPTPAASSTTTATCSRLAITFVVDRSGSMTGTPIVMARTAIADSLDALSVDDCIEVIAFDSVPTRTIAMQSVTDVAALKSEVSRLQTGGGTQAFGALDMARADIEHTTAKTRHIILLTDGQFPKAGLNDLAATMAQQSITLSTIALGSMTDEPLLRTLATTGNGRFHQVPDPNGLPGVYAKEVRAALP